MVIVPRFRIQGSACLCRVRLSWNWLIGEEASRAFQVIDHAADDIDGMISVVGASSPPLGSWPKAADLASIKLGRKGSCRTAVEEIVL